MRTGNKRAMSAILAFLLLLAMVTAISGVVYNWEQKFQSNMQAQSSASVNKAMQTMGFNVRILSLNATWDGAILENRGANSLTKATVWVNGSLTAINQELVPQISPYSLGIIPLNTTITGQSEVKVFAIDSAGLTTIAQAILTAS